MSDLTAEKLLELMRKYAAPQCVPDLFNPFPLRRFMGLEVYEAPPSPPKLQVRDIKFADGTSILAPAFRAEMNAWLLERFGYQEDIYKDKVYVLGNYGLVASRSNAAIIRNCL